MVGPQSTLGHQDVIAHVLKCACLLGLAAQRQHCDAFLPHQLASLGCHIGKQKQELVSSVGFAHACVSAWCVRACEWEG